jgi:hypothetical protein
VELFLAVLGATGVLMAIAANATSIARYVGERRRAGPPSNRRAAPVLAVSRAASGPVGAPPAAAEVSPQPGAARTHAVPIRTPDQRVRVFVSSTLASSPPSARRRARDRVAAADARAVRARGAPTSAARPVPRVPRPERRLRGDLRCALRVGRAGRGRLGFRGRVPARRRTAEARLRPRRDGPREPALERLLERIRRDDHTSYKSFRSAEELAESAPRRPRRAPQRTLRARGAAPPRTTDGGGAPFAATPARRRLCPDNRPRSSAASAARGVDRAAARPNVRLLTLYGPGGAGKSRVAIELATRTAEHFGGDVSYVSLAAVRDPSSWRPRWRSASASRRPSASSTVAGHAARLGRPARLLLIDNFEHLVEAAPVVADLVQAAPQLTVW